MLTTRWRMQNPYGDGQASRRIVEAIAYEMQKSDKTRYVYSKINKKRSAEKCASFAYLILKNQLDKNARK